MAQHHNKHPTHPVVIRSTTEQDEEEEMRDRTADIQVESIGLFVGVRSSTQDCVSHNDGHSMYLCMDASIHGVARSPSKVPAMAILRVES